MDRWIGSGGRTIGEVCVESNITSLLNIIMKTMIVLYDENFEVCVDYITSLHTIVMMVMVTIMMHCC